MAQSSDGVKVEVGMISEDTTPERFRANRVEQLLNDCNVAASNGNISVWKFLLDCLFREASHKQGTPEYVSAQTFLCYTVVPAHEKYTSLMPKRWEDAVYKLRAFGVAKNNLYSHLTELEIMIRRLLQ